MTNPIQNFLQCFFCLAMGTLLISTSRAALITTQAPGGITTNSAILYGTADPALLSTTAYFEYGTTTNYGTSTPGQALGNGTGNINYNQAISGLTSGLTYHFRAYVVRAATRYNGADLSFIVPILPTAATAAATSLHPGQATLNAVIGFNPQPVAYWFEHGPTTSYGNYTPTNVVPASPTANSVSSLITGLPRGLGYHFRLVATNAAGRASGGDLSFTVPQGATGPGGAAGGGQSFDLRQPTLEMNFMMCTNGTAPSSTTNAQPLLGEIRLFAGNSAPKGWVLCQGQLLGIASNLSLYSAIGTNYGGDGMANFALPDMRGYRPVGWDPGAIEWNYIGRKIVGPNQIVWTVAQLPTHTHTLPYPDTNSVTGEAGDYQLRPNVKSTLSLSLGIAYTGVSPIQGTTSIYEPFIGQISMFGGNFAPGGTYSTLGQDYSTNGTNAGLFAVIGTNFSFGAYPTNFGLPYLGGQVPMGIGQGPTTNRSIGQQDGFEQFYLNVNQIPSHQHTLPTVPGALTGFTGSNQSQTLMQPSVAIQYLIATNGQVPSATVQATNAMIGEVQMFAATNIPLGWLRCDGRVLNITAAPSLFGVISNFYGGDGITTFALPNMSGRVPVGPTNNQPGAAYGVEVATMTLATMPAHTHTGPVADYDRWISSFGLSGATASFTNDADGDGADNGFEWATGTNPTNSSPALLTINSISNKVFVNFPRNTNATDVIMLLQKNTNINGGNTWTGIATNTAGVWNPSALVTETGTNNPVSVNVSDIRTNHPAAIYRLNIVWP